MRGSADQNYPPGGLQTHTENASKLFRRIKAFCFRLLNLVFLTIQPVYIRAWA